jgi:hypothetical protein
MVESYMKWNHGVNSNVKLMERYARNINMNIETVIGLVIGFIILVLVFIFSIISWELYKRDYK